MNKVNNELYYVAINFDLIGQNIKDNLKAQGLKEETFRRAFSDIERFLTQKNKITKVPMFSHPQESSYTSNIPMTILQAQGLIEDMVNKYPYLKGSFDSMFITTIDDIYDVTNIVKDTFLTTIIEDKDLYKEVETNYSIKLDEKAPSNQVQIRLDLIENVAKDCLITQGYKPNSQIVYNMIDDSLSEHYQKGQRSVYISKEPRTPLMVINDIMSLSNKLSTNSKSNEYNTLNKCIKSLQVSIVTKDYDVTQLANGEISIDVAIDNNLNNENNTSIGLEL